MKKFLKICISVLAGLYVILCGYLYFFQEKLIFLPEKLSKNFTFKFPQKFEEMNIKASDGTLLNGLLFKVKKPKGLIFYVHGNGGILRTWGDVAKTYEKMDYDLFIYDFRGYGKSEGKITDEKQLFDDDQLLYDHLKKQYPETKIVVMGYSIGTGPAAKLASENSPKLLVLQAPYYNLKDMMKQLYPVIPTFILRYNFATNEYLKKCRMPVAIFHGTKDEVIYYGSSLKLEKEFKKSDTLITLKGEVHNKITDNLQYQSALEKLMNRARIK